MADGKQKVQRSGNVKRKCWTWNAWGQLARNKTRCREEGEARWLCHAKLLDYYDEIIVLKGIE